MPDPTPVFDVVLGTDFAGKSTVMRELARDAGSMELISTDEMFLAREYKLVSRLRRDVLDDVLPAVGERYSPDFVTGLLQMAVIHLRDRICGSTTRRPVLVDSYYYKILAKCRLAGVADNPMFAWWRSFPQPRRVFLLDVTAETAWRRSRGRGALNRWEHYGERPARESFERFQADLRVAMLKEVGAVPVTVIEEQSGPRRTADALRAVVHA